MKRRLRKKKHLGEFQELGFDVSAKLRPDLDTAAHDALLDRLMAMTGARQLGFTGGGNYTELEGFVSRLVRGSTSEEDRQAVAAFLDGDEAVVSHEVGTLRDAWYGWTGQCCACSGDVHEH